MTRYFIWVILIVLMMAGIKAKGQTPSPLPKIKIVYIDSLTLKPIENVSVLLFKQNDTTKVIDRSYSDRLGEVCFDLAPKSSYRIVASFLGEVVHQDDINVSEEERGGYIKLCLIEGRCSMRLSSRLLR